MREYNRSSREGRDSGRRSFGGGGRSERPQMFKATCDQCGRECEVPFRPSGDKPVYCSDCFEGKREDGGDRGGDRSRGRFESRDRRPNFDRGYGRDRGEKQMFPAVCDQCGQPCEVPFKPSSDKPIFCSKCFEGKENNRSEGRSNGGNNNNSELKAQIEALNNKLDRVLNILMDKKVATKAVKEEVAKTVKEEVKKPVKKTIKKVAKAKKEVVVE
jgi:CxxC-x17-CxxC domain-containing protein